MDLTMVITLAWDNVDCSAPQLLPSCSAHSDHNGWDVFFQWWLMILLIELEVGYVPLPKNSRTYHTKGWRLPTILSNLMELELGEVLCGLSMCFWKTRWAGTFAGGKKTWDVYPQQRCGQFTICRSFSYGESIDFPHLSQSIRNTENNY